MLQSGTPFMAKLLQQPRGGCAVIRSKFQRASKDARGRMAARRSVCPKCELLLANCVQLFPLIVLWDATQMHPEYSEDSPQPLTLQLLSVFLPFWNVQYVGFKCKGRFEICTTKHPPKNNWRNGEWKMMGVGAASWSGQWALQRMLVNHAVAFTVRCWSIDCSVVNKKLKCTKYLPMKTFRIQLCVTLTCFFFF